jgi:hypothetical protein
LVHGRDQDATKVIEDSLSDLDPSVTLIKLNRQAIPGRALVSEIERLGPQCDAAIVLLTPDDLAIPASGARPDVEQEFRARDNVWLEVGWFWARLGLSRTLLVREERVALASDLQGVWHLTYRDSLQEITNDIHAWLSSLGYATEASSTEIVSSTSATGTRAADYEFIHDQARSSLTITGIGMMNLRQRLPVLVRQVEERELKVTIVSMAPDFIAQHQALIDATYRPGLAGDLVQFRSTLSHFGRNHAAALQQITLLGYSGLLTFVATAADLHEPGSVMIAEPYLPSGAFSMVDRPRMVLKRRIEGGLYDRYAAGITAIVEASSPLGSVGVNEEIS